MATIINLSTLSATYYRVTAVDNAGNQSEYSSSVSTTSTSFKDGDDSQETVDALPEEFALHQNYPNPFNPTTEIKFDLSDPAQVNLTIFSIAGQKIRTLVDAPRLAGYHSILWDGKDELGNDVASGVYLYRISVAANKTGSSTVVSKRMTLLR